MTFPLPVGHKGSNWAADRGARFDCLSTAKNPKVRHARKVGLRAPRLEVIVQRRWSSVGRMERCHRGGVHMQMLATRSKQDTWKNSSAAGVRPIALCRVMILVA